jgi:RNA polymerase sigma factor (sigma-70 family)
MKEKQAKIKKAETKTKAQLNQEASDHIRKIKSDYKYAEVFFYTTIKPMVCTIARKLCNCYKEDIDPTDICTALYIALWDKGTWKRLDSYDYKGYFFSWLSLIATHEAFRHFDKLGYRRFRAITTGNTRIRLLRQPLEVRKAVVNLVDDKESYRYLKLRYIDKKSVAEIAKKLKLNDEEIKTKKRVAERMLKINLINSKSEYLDIVLRRTDNPCKYEDPDKAANIASKDSGYDDLPTVMHLLKDKHGISDQYPDFDARLERYIRMNAKEMGIRGKKIDIFVQRFVYEEKPAKIAKRFSVERSYVDNVKSNGIRRFKNYVLATCKAS